MNSTNRVVIEPKKGWVPIDLKELWGYRELAWALAMREVLVRYKQSVLGVAWAVLQPTLTMLVFTVLFGILLGQGNLPILWRSLCRVNLLRSVAMATVRAIGVPGKSEYCQQPEPDHENILPSPNCSLAPVLAALVDFAIAFAVLVVLMSWYGIAPGANVVWLPLLLLLAVICALACAVGLAALNAIYRDVQHVVPFVVQLLMYVSPVLYSASSVLKGKPEWVQILYGLNPMAGVIESFRWALLKTPPPDPAVFASSVCAVSLLFVISLFYFRRMEKTFADLV